MLKTQLIRPENVLFVETLNPLLLLLAGWLLDKVPPEGNSGRCSYGGGGDRGGNGGDSEFRRISAVNGPPPPCERIFKQKWRFIKFLCTPPRRRRRCSLLGLLMHPPLFIESINIGERESGTGKPKCFSILIIFSLSGGAGNC